MAVTCQRLRPPGRHRRHVTQAQKSANRGPSLSLPAVRRDRTSLAGHSPAGAARRRALGQARLVRRVAGPEGRPSPLSCLSISRTNTGRAAPRRATQARSASARRIIVRSGASVGTTGVTNPRPWVSAITSRRSSPARRAKVVPWKAGDHADHLRHGEMRAR
jgi:hypothetical protein